MFSNRQQQADPQSFLSLSHERLAPIRSSFAAWMLTEVAWVIPLDFLLVGRWRTSAFCLSNAAWRRFHLQWQVDHVIRVSSIFQHAIGSWLAHPSVWSFSGPSVSIKGSTSNNVSSALESASHPVCTATTAVHLLRALILAVNFVPSVPCS